MTLWDYYYAFYFLDQTRPIVFAAYSKHDGVASTFTPFP
ncbi:hypothetical protein VCRA2123E76_10410 [Vibrio crassostreae]|nr:hypothetical protein VCRA2123E76_10410 [Vibrio crassostreae]